jgi:hypothetical protein
MLRRPMSRVKLSGPATRPINEYATKTKITYLPIAIHVVSLKV